MFFTTPRYIKQAKLLDKGVHRFLQYKRDILPAPKLEEITRMHGELRASIKQRDAKKIAELTTSINKACHTAMPSTRRSEWADHMTENVEVFFVSIVIAIGIRTYIAQPFQIPTSSMQPTLNGITAQSTETDPGSGLWGKITGFFTGTTYLNVVSDHEGVLRQHEPITEDKWFIFRPYSVLHFADGHTIKIQSPKMQLLDELHLADNINSTVTLGDNNTADRRHTYYLKGGEYIRKGQLLARGIVRNGDHVIVNKFAYHFRQPTRGEVFVFTTKNINRIERETRFDKRWGSQHYIKRLVGLPGDTITVEPPQLLINGQKATEPGIRRVIDEAKPRLPNGDVYTYHGYSHETFDMPYVPITLGKSPRREYFAMGDNSYRSSDGRSWGAVPEQNVVGPGWFCYWPLTSHWGRIR